MYGSYFARLCLAGSLVGLLAMALLLQFYKAREIELEELKDVDGEDRVRIRGTISSISGLDKISIIEIGYEETVSITVFEDGILKLAPGEEVRVEGRVQEFRGKNQLVADEIVKVK